MRVENVKNSVWTVDDEEYYKRRTPRGVGPSPTPGSNQSPTLTPHAPSIIDQVSCFDMLYGSECMVELLRAKFLLFGLVSARMPLSIPHGSLFIVFYMVNTFQMTSFTLPSLIKYFEELHKMKYFLTT